MQQPCIKEIEQTLQDIEAARKIQAILAKQSSPKNKETLKKIVCQQPEGLYFSTYSALALDKFKDMVEGMKQNSCAKRALDSKSEPTKAKRSKGDTAEGKKGLIKRAKEDEMKATHLTLILIGDEPPQEEKKKEEKKEKKDAEKDAEVVVVDLKDVELKKIMEQPVDFSELVQEMKDDDLKKILEQPFDLSGVGQDDEVVFE